MEERLKYNVQMMRQVSNRKTDKYVVVYLYNVNYSS